ncbi:MAG: FHA domain-containing protein [Deltaproteobacteria bacterium]|nr:FHA domain-containing protein [Deltaproteobacteria bacterium]
MSILRRLLSSDYRRAVAAEAASDYLLAARCYALAGERQKVAEMHLLRAERLASRSEEIAALRDALRWTPEGSSVHKRTCRALAEALLARAKAEGMATQKDRDAVHEAAMLLQLIEDPLAAGEAWERLGDDEQAARAYEQAGAIEQLERTLGRIREQGRVATELRDAFRTYELAHAGGDRVMAVDALRTCCALAVEKGEYRRLLDRLESRRISSGRVGLRGARGGVRLLACAKAKVTLGREPGCDLVLRSASVSRHHASIVVVSGLVSGSESEAEFFIRDEGSHHGTWLCGIPIAGDVRLGDRGEVALGGDCVLSFLVTRDLFRAEIGRGAESACQLVVLPPSARVDLFPILGIYATLEFDDGRPYLAACRGMPLLLNGEKLAGGRAQLVREDVVSVDGVEVVVD